MRFPGNSEGTQGVCVCVLHDAVSWSFKKWSNYGHSLVIFIILALFWLNETGQVWSFRAFPGEPSEEMAWTFASDVSRSPSELFKLWSQFVDFSNFGTILILWNGSISGFSAILVMLCRLSSLWWGIFPILCVEFCLVILFFYLKRRAVLTKHLHALA